MSKEIGAYLSPGKIHGFDFVFDGEIRFGPAYYKIKLDGELVNNRIFGFEFKWHPDSKYLALQEWMTTDYQKGPITALTIVDLKSRNLARVSKADKGFIRPLKFEKNLIIFEKDFLAKGKTVEYEINYEEIDNWEK